MSNYKLAASTFDQDPIRTMDADVRRKGADWRRAEVSGRKNSTSGMSAVWMNAVTRQGST